MPVSVTVNANKLDALQCFPRTELTRNTTNLIKL